MRIFQVDAFTDTRFTGNPAVVVLDADGRSDSTLQAIAREFAHAEVAFVLAATAADHDVRLRFFNARKEAPFVGHATIAAHAVLLSLGRRAEGVCRQLSGTGIIEVQAHDHGGALIEFRQIAPELAAPLPPDTTLRVAEALRLPSAQLHPLMPTRIARRGSTRLLLPVGEARTLDALNPNFDALVALGKELGADGFFVFSISRHLPDPRPFDGNPPGPNPLGLDLLGVNPLGLNPLDRPPQQLTTDSRMFCPAIGIPEDPVSGNAHAMLAAYLWELGEFGRGPSAFIGLQGRRMNRPGEVGVRLETRQGSLVAAHIGGRAVIVSEGTMT
jgi:PhzF family phenazine biosynthesis protein